MIDEKKLIEELYALADKESRKCDEAAEANLTDILIKYNHGESCYYNAVETVNSQPKIGGWIPCSEKYPEWGTTSYLVCLKNGGVFLALYLSSGEFKEISSMGTREFCENNPVVAWMPLPDPYEVKENG